MKRVVYILLSSLFFLLAYSAFLFFFPLKKKVSYTNEERIEQFVYSRQEFPIVIVGSSLSGVLDKDSLFEKSYYSLYLPYTGSCTGLEVLRRTKKIPAALFIEMNHIERGIDSAIISKLFTEPVFSVKRYFPFLQKGNMLLPNLMDRVKKPQKEMINAERPPEKLYDLLLTAAKKEWSTVKDTARINKAFDQMAYYLQYLAKNGCKICFYEMPMDSSLMDSPLLNFQKKKMLDYIRVSGGFFIPADTSSVYGTGDGVHLLEDGARRYNAYFKTRARKIIQ